MVGCFSGRLLASIARAIPVQVFGQIKLEGVYPARPSVCTTANSWLGAPSECTMLSTTRTTKMMGNTWYLTPVLLMPAVPLTKTVHSFSRIVIFSFLPFSRLRTELSMALQGESTKEFCGRDLVIFNRLGRRSQSFRCKTIASSALARRTGSFGMRDAPPSITT
jgi:hypothetical protein